MPWEQIVKNFSKSMAKLPRQQTHKRCLGCEKMLPFSDFYSRGEGNRLTSRCKPCYKAHQKQRKA
jgi:hypothetical protein